MTLFLILLIISVVQFEFGAAECEPTRCHASGPVIRFPFRLVGRQPEHCGYPGFDLSCSSKDHSTELQFQFQNITLKATANEIDYSNQWIRVIVIPPVSCPSNSVPIASNFSSPFEMDVSDYGIALFSCPAVPPSTEFRGPITCPDLGGFQLYPISSANTIWSLPSSPSCVKMYNISRSFLFGGGIRLRWRIPDCGSCEARGMNCRLNNSATHDKTECFHLHISNNKGKANVAIIVATTVVGALLIVVAIAFISYYVYNVRNRRIRRFLEDYAALRPTRYTYSDIKKITDGFKHILGRGGYGTVFKGSLSTNISVAVKVLSNIKGKGEDFVNEVGTIGKIHHLNVVRLVGYCADGNRRALVYEYLENDSLENYILSHNKKSMLGWEKLHEIALGIAKGIDYLHQGCNQRILHFDIKPQNILLDHNLNPKVADFGLAKLCSKDQSVVTLTAARGTIGYIAPEVFSRNFGKVSYKSDIYSYGMLLLDMVGGKKGFDGRGQGSDEVYFPEWMYNQLEKSERIAIQVEKEDQIDIVKKLIIVGLWCIQWYPMDRPSMKIVIQMLEGESMPIMPPNPFGVDSNSASSGSPNGGESSIGSGEIEE